MLIGEAIKANMHKPLQDTAPIIPQTNKSTPSPRAAGSVAFLADFRFIIFFLVLVLAIGALGNEQFLFYFLLLVFFSMIITQSDKFINLINTYEGGFTG